MFGVLWLFVMVDYDFLRFLSWIFDGNGLFFILLLSCKCLVFERFVICMFINVYKDLIILELKLFDMIVLFCIICILFYIWELMVVLGIMVFDSLILM